jgi:hypothetical protein
MALEFPFDWRDQPCFVVAIPLPLVPYVGGLLKLLEQRGLWASIGDYERAYTATVELERCLMATCLQDLLDKQDALYRLVNTGLFGVTYTLESSDPITVSPAIEPFVDLTNYDQDSIMGRIDRLVQLVDNSINGTETPLYSYDPSVKALLQGIIDALGSEDTDLADILSQLEIIAALVA